MAVSQMLPDCQFDADYLSGLKARDPGIENHFVAYFSPMMQVKLRRRSASLEQINEIRQETFARVLAAVRTDHRIRQPERLAAFVSGVCGNVLQESYRRGAHYPTLEDLAEELHDGAKSPEAVLASRETTRYVHLVLSRLPEKDRRVLAAVFLEEKKRDEICEELGVGRNHLRLLLHRAKKQFLKHWRDARSAH